MSGGNRVDNLQKVTFKIYSRQLFISISRLKEWVLGKAIGVGGFGELYLASAKLPDGQLSPKNYVIKVSRFEIICSKSQPSFSHCPPISAIVFVLTKEINILRHLVNKYSFDVEASLQTISSFTSSLRPCCTSAGFWDWIFHAVLSDCEIKSFRSHSGIRFWNSYYVSVFIYNVFIFNCTFIKSKQLIKL